MSSRAMLVERLCAAADIVRKNTHERVRRDILAARDMALRTTDRRTVDDNLIEADAVPEDIDGKISGDIDGQRIDGQRIDGPEIDAVIDAAFDLQHQRIVSALRGRTTPDATSRGAGREPARHRPAGQTPAGQTPAGHEPAAARTRALLRSRPDVALAACGAVVAETIECARTIGARLGCDPATVLDVVDCVVRVSHAAALPVPSECDTDPDLPHIGADDRLRGRLARTLLLGGASSGDIRSQVSVLGVDTGRYYVAFRAHPHPRNTVRDLALELGHGGCDRPRDGLVAYLDDDLVGFLATPPERVRAGVVGVGPPGILERLAESFELATRTLQTARAFGLSGVHTFDDLGLLPTVLADADIGESLCRRYLRRLAEVDPAPGLVNAMRTYFACGMHVERAAKQLRIHANTLRHRINRFEDLTGADLSDLSVAMQVWWALAHAARCDGGGARKGPADRIGTGTARHRTTTPVAWSGRAA
jgi:hypothetical protein